MRNARIYHSPDQSHLFFSQEEALLFCNDSGGSRSSVLCERESMHLLISVVCSCDVARERVGGVPFCIASGCTRSTLMLHLHAKTKLLPLKNCLGLRRTQVFSATAALEHLLHESYNYNPLDTQRQIQTTPSLHNIALCALIYALLLGKFEGSWLRESFIAKLRLSHLLTL